MQSVLLKSQLMPVAVTVPLPELPVLLTVNVMEVNIAITALASSIVTTQAPVPEHPAPFHPPKPELESAVAVRVTEVFKA